MRKARVPFTGIRHFALQLTVKSKHRWKVMGLEARLSFFL